MTIPTIEEYNAVKESIQQESPCEDGSCYHCKIGANLSKSEIPKLLVNNLLDKLALETMESLKEGKFDSFQIMGYIIQDAIAHGVIIGLTLSEIKELEKIHG